VREEFPQAHFYLIGGWIYDTLHDAGYEKGLHEKVQHYGLFDCVTFTGFQTHMPPWYRAMDLIVNASIHPEGFGRTLLEAMACGRAVIGPDAGGIPEFVENGGNGILYKMGDAVQLADAIISLLRNSDLRRRMGMAGRKVAVSRFGATAHAGEIIEILYSTFSSSS
jgi:glycosyltransferase involved in cell wall biosynthesis